MNLNEIKNLENKHILLKNINNDSLGVLHGRDIQFRPRFNGVSELTFTIDKKTCPYYDLITSYRLIEIQGLMKFIISNPQLNNDGINEYKTVLCKSYEVDINRKSIPLLQGTYKFYSPLQTDETIMSIIMSYLPNWTIKTIDSNLWNVYRTFDLANKLLLDFCLNECQTAYEAVFEFDTINQTISVIGFENIPKKTDIYLSNNNVVNELNLTEKTEDLYTALQVFGSGNLSINLVNPLGSTIYNFNHFLNKDGFMSDELKTAILEWQDLIDVQQPIYANHLVNRKIKLSELITLQTQLTELESELKALEITRDALLDSGLSAVSKNTEVKNKRIEITNKKSEINSKQDEIDLIDDSLQDIQNIIGFDKYFTTEQLLQLEPFKIQTSITDENFVVTEQDSEIEKQEMAQALYDKYKKILDDSSNLRFEFSTNLIDFISLKEYQNFTNQLQWGSQVTLKVNDKGDLVYPMLLGLDIDWNDEINIQYLFSTEVKLSDKIIEYDDFSNEISNMSNKMAGDSIKWGEFTRTSKDRLYDIFENGLRADLTQIVNANNQELIINEQGLLARREISAGVFEDEQVKLIHNKLAFTKDNWNSLSTVLGKVTLPDGSQSFGLNAEVIMGKLIAGNQLVIANSNNTFVVDSLGAKLTNASLTIEKGLNKILLDPTNGFKIQKKVGTAFNDMIYLDTEGNAVFKGNIDASTITGSSLNGGSVDIGQGNFTVDNTGKVSIKRGSFNIANIFTVDTDGTVSIKKGSLNINSNFIVDQLGNVNMTGTLNIANKLLVDGAGNMTIYGGSISWASSDPAIALAQNTGNDALSKALNAISSANSAYNFAYDVDNELSKVKSNIGYTKIGSDYVISPIIRGGMITSDTTINVGTNATIGNAIYLGELSSGSAKTIYFNNTARIVGGGGMYGGDIMLIANRLNLENINGIDWGNNMPDATARFA